MAKNGTKTADRKAKRLRALELSMKVMEVTLFSRGPRVRARQSGWNITIAKRDGLTFTYCTAETGEVPDRRPYCLAIRPSKKRAAQVSIDDGGERSPVFFAESDDDHLPKALIFQRGEWEDHVLTLSKAIFADLMGGRP